MMSPPHDNGQQKEHEKWNFSSEGEANTHERRYFLESANDMTQFDRLER
jgi:hypothetical protein